mmetsp:Transcript_12376/g.23193  ORF Transcript_12376/g.23193 Transcript_12376/m.23193 type:complete len:96 (+) Transcript_12376:1002-1289(+)
MQHGGKTYPKQSRSQKTRGSLGRLLSKRALLVLRLGVGIRKWLRRRGDVKDGVLEFTPGEFLGYEKNVNDSESDAELDGEVGASEHEYDIGIFAV